MPFPFLLAAALTPEPAACGPALRVAFTDGAPVDRVTVQNVSRGAWSLTRLEWRLDGSAGDLVFDPETGGAGIAVAQPFREDGGEARIETIPAIVDGARLLTLDFTTFPSGARYRFTLDLDDRVEGRPGTIVSGSEIAGARISARFADSDGVEIEIEGVFDADGVARARSPCAA